MNFTWNCMFLTNIGMLLSILYVYFIFYSLKSFWSINFSSTSTYCVHVCTCICVYVCSYMHLWRLKVKTGYLPINIHFMVFSTRYLTECDTHLLISKYVGCYFLWLPLLPLQTWSELMSSYCWQSLYPLIPLPVPTHKFLGSTLLWISWFHFVI